MSSKSYQEEPVAEVVTQWNLPSQVKDLIIDKYPEIIPDIIHYREAEPFDSSVPITSYSCLVEGVTVLLYEAGKPTYLMPDFQDYEGDYSEHYLNEELVLMEVKGEAVINRITPAIKNNIYQILHEEKAF